MPKVITVGVDVRDLQTAKTGTKTYLEELCKQFEKLDLPDVKFKFIDTIIPVYTGKNRILTLIGHFRYLAWKQLILPVKALFKGCNIVFCTDTIVPYINFGFKTIPVFHDAFFFETPDNYGKLWLWLYLKTALPAAKKSSFVVTPSVHAKKQIHKYTGISMDKLMVVYEGPKEKAQNFTGHEILDQLGLEGGKYLLHVGSMFKRKNIPNLIRAFSKLKVDGYNDIKLVLAGSTSPASVESSHSEIMDAIEKYELHDDVIFTGYLSDESIAQLYHNALAYVFPSLNEGFGIPVLEAFQYQLPVLAADNTSLPEIGGDAVALFNPNDVEGMHRKIKSVIDDADLRTLLSQKGAERLKQFSWEKAALELVDIFKKAV